MNRRRTLGVVVVLCLVVGGGVQLADPFDTAAETADKPGPNADATAVLTYSLSELETADYTYDVDFVSESGGRRQFVHARIDHSDHEYVFSGPLGDDGTVYYGNEFGAWSRTGDGAWTHLGVFKMGFDYDHASFRTPFDPSAIPASKTTFVEQTPETVVIRVDSTSPNSVTNGSTPAEGYTLYRLDAETYTLEAATEHTTIGGESVRAEIEISDRGTTDVARPPGTKSIVLDTLGDLVH